MSISYPPLDYVPKLDKRQLTMMAKLDTIIRKQSDLERKQDGLTAALADHLGKEIVLDAPVSDQPFPPPESDAQLATFEGVKFMVSLARALQHIIIFRYLRDNQTTMCPPNIPFQLHACYNTLLFLDNYEITKPLLVLLTFPSNCRSRFPLTQRCSPSSRARRLPARTAKRASTASSMSRSRRPRTWCASSRSSSPIS